MANPHSSVNYVEPNLTATGFFKDTGEGNVNPWKFDDDYERAPRLEDYSIYFNLEVEICSRENISANRTITSDVLIMSYRTKQSDSASTVNFMGGTKVKCCDAKNTSMQYLTTRYADMYVGDLIDYGTTEMIGVKSVDIEYQSSCVPIVTVRFTDVRGLSLFQPTELSRTNSYQGINGINADNVAQSFFQCFFRVPMPRFTMTIKGFYGKPVTYECMCDKFDTEFNSNTGDFDIVTRFIGYSYSFLTDVSIDALFAAPYSDYGGKNGNYNSYWDEQKAAKRFVCWNREKTHEDPMPTLYEIWEEMKDLLSTDITQDTPIVVDDRTHAEEIEELQGVRDLYRRWYKTLFNLCVERYGKDYCFLFKNIGNNDDYHRILILTKNSNIKTLEDDYSQYSNEFKKLNEDLYAAIEKFNAKEDNFKKLRNVSLTFDNIFSCNLFNNTYLTKNGEVVFNGFHKYNKLPETEVVNNVFYGIDYESGATIEEIKEKEKKHKKHILRTIYDDGIDQYVRCYSLDFDYSPVLDRIKMLQADANKSDEEISRQNKVKLLNDKLFEQMSWYPSVKNFTKIMMAHFETLMHLMYNVATNCEGRTATELGVSTGPDGSLPDVNPSKETIPPFPRVTRNILGDDRITKVEDTWVGEYNKGQRPFEEVDFIDGFFNAIEKIRALMKDRNMERGEEAREIQSESEVYGGVIKHPLCAFDFWISTTPYGDSETISNDIHGYEFAGRIAIRMFDILTIGRMRLGLNVEELARTEAENFKNSIKLINSNFYEMLRNGTISAENIIDMITRENDPSKCPWGNRKLFSKDSNHMWLDGYKMIQGNDSNYIYPIQNIYFDNMESLCKGFNDVGLTRYGYDVSLSTLPPSLKSTENGYGNVFITDYFKLAEEVLEKANSDEESSDYTNIYNKIEEVATFNEERQSKYVDWFRVNGAPSVCSYIHEIKDEKITNMKEDGHSLSVITSDGEYAYTSEDIDDIGEEVKVGNTTNYTITEIFGLTEDGDIDLEGSFYDVSLKLNKELRFDNMTLHPKIGFRALMALLLIRTNDSKFIDALIKNKCNVNAFTYIPRLCLLQLGALCFAIGWAQKNPLEDVYSTIRSTLGLNNPAFLKNKIQVISFFNKQTRYELAKYFYKWVTTTNIGINFAYNLEKNKDAGKNYIISTNGKLKRKLLKQSSDFIKKITNDLLMPVLFMPLSINSKLKSSNGTLGGSREYFSKNDFDLSPSLAERYLTAFIEKLKQLYQIDYEEDENGNLIKTTDEPRQTNEDMKIELYRYMKQLYDKWIPMTSFDDWTMDKFFLDGEGGEKVGHKFYFIDSYYNDISDKLLINPKDLMDRITAVLETRDINAMMLGFMADIYASNKCMMKCIQNFFDLTKEGSMNEMFLPMSYNSIDWNKEVNKFSSFVIVYPYEPSKNLNIPNSEYNNDGFMLNDENETPKPIRSKSDAKGMYRIPAFGVAYGKQYQSYFKTVHINMKSPIATEQSIKAKHYILQQSANVKSRGVVGQDLYDVYTNQSYTCDVEMMGCAWVQPMMYFVLLNIPMFRGSYLIMKVKHSIRPGDMTTTFTGCRMANVSNRLVENIFTDDDFLMDNEYFERPSTSREINADMENDCPYKIYPLWDISSGELNGDEKQKASQLMDKLMAKGFTKVAAAGIVGNMYVETSPKFDHTSVNGNDKGYIAGGLCQWNDRYYNLTNLLNNTTADYGQKENHSYTWLVKDVKDKLINLGVDHQIDFIDKTIGKVTVRGSKTRYSKELLNQCKTAREAARSFEYNYERSDGTTVEDHKDKRSGKLIKGRTTMAEEFFNSYGKTSYSNDSKPSNKDVNDKKDVITAFFEAIRKSALDTPSIGVPLVMETRQSGKSKTYLRITQANGNEKLGNVFDMILNSEYYNYVEELGWVYENGGIEMPVPPIAIFCLVKENVEPNNKKVWITLKGQFSGSMIPNSLTTGNTILMKALAKHRKSLNDDSKLMKEVPQVKDISILTGYEPQNCDSAMNSGGNGGVNYGTNAKPSEVSKKIQGSIDGWDVGKVVAYINRASTSCTAQMKKCGNGKCATVVEEAIKAGGGPLSTKIATSEVHDGSIHATNLHYDGILAKHGFVQIMSGTVQPRGNVDSSLLQAGDVCIIGKNARVEGGKYHACLWVGDKWVSDFKQPNMNVYQTAYPYFIYRFRNKKLS